MNSDFDRARETLAKAVNIAPDDAQVRRKYGEYLRSKLETRSEGLRQLQKARQLNPNLPRIDFDIGKTQFDLTDFRSATDSFEAELKKTARDGKAASSWRRPVRDWGTGRRLDNITNTRWHTSMRMAPRTMGWKSFRGA